MQISITVPDEIGRELRARWEDLPRHALEVLVADAYRQSLLSAGQVREVLGLSTRLDLDAFLKQAGAYLHYTEAELDADQRSLEELLAR